MIASSHSSLRFAIVTLPDQRLAVGGQNLSADTERRIRRHEAHRRLVLAECALATGRVQVPAQSPVQEPGAHRVHGRVHLEECHPGQGDGSVRVTCQIRRLGCELHHLDMIAPRTLPRVGHLIPELERRFELALGIGEPVRRQRLQSCLYRGGQCAAWIVSSHPVVREPSGRGSRVRRGQFRVLGQRLGKAACRRARSPGSSSVYNASWVSACRKASVSVSGSGTST